MENFYLEPKLQAFHDVFMELHPDSQLSTFDKIRKGIKYCIDNDCEPENAVIDLRECPMPFCNVSH